MSKYAIENPNIPKVLAKGYEPVQAWRGGWYSGWRVKSGWKWQHIYIIAEGTVRKFPLKTKYVKLLNTEV